MAEIFTDGTAAGPCVPVGQRRYLHVHRLRARSEAFNDMVRKLHAGSKVLPSTPAFLPVWSHVLLLTEAAQPAVVTPTLECEGMCIPAMHLSP